VIIVRFWSDDEVLLTAPKEWESAWIELVQCQRDAVCSLHNTALSVYEKRIAGSWRVVVYWKQANAGEYTLRINGKKISFWIYPYKLNLAAFEKLLHDLEYQLPCSIALALKQQQVLAGMRLRYTTTPSLAQEKLRVTTAVNALCQLLPLINQTIQKNLSPHHRQVAIEQVRRPVLSSTNLLSQHMMWEQYSESHFDTIENQLVKYYVRQVQQKIQQLLIFSSIRHDMQRLQQILQQLVQTYKPFFQHVTQVNHPPLYNSAVFQYVPCYTALLRSYLNYHQYGFIDLHAPQLRAPLHHMPWLYQMWTSLQVIQRLIHQAKKMGYHIQQQYLYQLHDPHYILKLLPANRTILTLCHQSKNKTLQLIPERIYHDKSCMSHQQRPDLALEIMTPDQEIPSVYLFETKYKLQHPQDKPYKADIDKLHAYRDAILYQGQKIVHHAVLLYLGQTYHYPSGLQALQAHPDHEEALHQELDSILSQALV